MKLDVAQAEARALEAQVALEKFKAPRAPNDEQQKKMIEQLRQFAGTPFDFAVNNDNESTEFFVVLSNILMAAGWIERAWDNAPAGDLHFHSGTKKAAGIAIFSGVVIEVDVSKVHEWEKPVAALQVSLKDIGVEARAMAITGNKLSPNAIHINIRRKEN